MSHLKHITAFFLLTLGACTEIPDIDTAFLDQQISVGTNAQTAKERVERRGFTELREISFTLRSSTFNEETGLFEHHTRPASLEQRAQRGIGFVKLVGNPKGQLSCFSRGYALFIASGDRLICWTTGHSGLITWRQAGWRGAML